VGSREGPLSCPAKARGGWGLLTTVAAVDCGTNSTRLLVHDGDKPLERRATITRLGAGVDLTGKLDEAAMGRTIEVLGEYRSVLEHHGADRLRVAATSAVRDASNGEAFLDAAEAAVGSRPEILTGIEEGRLAFAGAVAELDPAGGPFLIVDIGGGSTEFVVGTAAEAARAVSVDVGCVRVTERFLRSDPPSPEELSDAIGVVRAYLDDVERELPEVREAARLVGLAGTVTTMAAVEMGLQAYDRGRVHHFVLTRDAAEDVFRTLATEKRADRIFNPGLEEARADVIVGGALVLVTIMRWLDADDCLVSEADILDGLVGTLLRPRGH
jgi:exopolyphosphatase / guanosine-5'-triphosphate,3'-diphosphate pyrophosphatase